MNDTHNIGKRVSGFESYNPVGPITGIDLIIDDSNKFTSGNDEGYVLEIQCPYGTQTMADNLLNKLKGKIYRAYHAEDAELSLSAELGDGVSVNGLYSLLAYRCVNFGPGHFSEISAPGESELEHEYPYITSEQRQIERQITGTRSLISKTSEEILLQVEQLDGKLGQTLRVAADGVTITNADGDTLTIDGGQIDASKIKAEDIDASKINADDLVLTGTISWADLTSAVQSSISDASSNASSALTAANGAYTAANGAVTNLAKLANGQYQGGTFISGTSIYSPELVGDEIKLANGSSYEVGKISLQVSNTPAFDITSNLSLRLQSAAGWNAYLGNGYSDGSGSVAAVLCGATGTLNLYGAAIAVSAANFGTTLPASGVPGQVFFLLE